MTRPTRRFCFGAVLLASCAARLPAAVAAEPERPQPIWVSPQLGLGTNVPDPREAARRAMAAPFEDVPSAIVQTGSERITKPLHDCNELIADASRIIGAASDQEYRVLRFIGARCRALAFVSEAGPPTRSLLEGFRLDGENLRYLPPALALTISPEAEQQVSKLEAERGNILQFDPSIRLMPARARNGEPIPDTAMLQAEDWSAKLTLYARADFDHDGFEDILLRRDAGTKGGTYALSSIFVLTRRQPGTVLDIVWPPRR